MSLPSSGVISLSQVATELGRSATASTSLGETAVRNLAGVASGAISLASLQGKSAYTAMTGTLDDIAMDGQANAFQAYTATYPISILVNNGLAPFTFAWSHVSGFGSVDAANSANSTVRMPVPRYGTPETVTTQVVQCTVTDAKGNTLTKQCTVYMTLM